MSSKNNILRLLIAVAMLACVVDGIEGQQPKPAELQTIYVHEDDVLDGSQTLAERAFEVDAVIRCKVLQTEVKTARTSDLPQGVDPKFGIDVYTEHTVSLLEVFKAKTGIPPVGATLQVIQRIGEAIVGNFRVRKVNDAFPPFERGQEYVLFLQWDKARSRFVAARSDAFLLSGGKVATKGSAPYSSREDTSSSSDFLERLRTQIPSVQDR